jgi:hypothetical protein
MDRPYRFSGYLPLRLHCGYDIVVVTDDDAALSLDAPSSMSWRAGLANGL